MDSRIFFDRDLSWLSFNGRVLAEAGKATVPLVERIRFLSIFSSNLDEFYRVRMPALLALQKIDKEKKNEMIYSQAVAVINGQQAHYGQILIQDILPALSKINIHFVYNEPLPGVLSDFATATFFTQVAGLLHPVLLSGASDFFPENNQLYLVAIVQNGDEDEALYLINIPGDAAPRFLKTKVDDTEYIIFLEDIIKANLQHLFKDATIKGAFNIKITRDAELNLQEEYDEDLAEKIEKQLSKRDKGFATRFLYEPGIPLRHLQAVVDAFNLHKASVVEGGTHHNLRDLASFPIRHPELEYSPWPAIQNFDQSMVSLFDLISQQDRMVHAPYQSYDTILRFFNEASIDANVQEVYTTLYRIAHDSKIAQALISAAKNGKKVTVMVELKARFDEANNLRWAKKMKAAGVNIEYSNNLMKVHAKVALVKRKHGTQPYLALLATGNLNESTARFYTDHILLTANQPMLAELDLLFGFLAKHKKADKEDSIPFKHLLVAQFNLQTRFLELIDREIINKKNGLPASILIKLNNLEEETMIQKLYEASNAGVEIRLLVRSICRLVPGIAGQSENIRIKRIVDRYLEHGRVFVFHDKGSKEVYMGSADWMNRNIYRRVEVCFPIYNEHLKTELVHLLELQWQDNVQAVWIDAALENVPAENEEPKIRSQESIYDYLLTKTNP